MMLIRSCLLVAAATFAHGFSVSEPALVALDAHTVNSVVNVNVERRNEISNFELAEVEVSNIERRKFRPLKAIGRFLRGTGEVVKDGVGLVVGGTAFVAMATMVYTSYVYRRIESFCVDAKSKRRLVAFNSAIVKVQNSKSDLKAFVEEHKDTVESYRDGTERDLGIIGKIGGEVVPKVDNLVTVFNERCPDFERVELCYIGFPLSPFKELFTAIEKFSDKQWETAGKIKGTTASLLRDVKKYRDSIVKKIGYSLDGELSKADFKEIISYLPDANQEEVSEIEIIHYTVDHNDDANVVPVDDVIDQIIDDAYDVKEA